MTNYSARSKSFTARIFYTPKGQAQITIPAPLIKRFAKPDAAMFYEQDGRIIVHFKKIQADAGNNESV